MIQTTYKKRISDIPENQLSDWDQLLNTISPNPLGAWVSPRCSANDFIYLVVIKDEGEIVDIYVYRRAYKHDGLRLYFNQLKEFALHKLVLGE